jgi:hypothetical protein
MASDANLLHELADKLVELKDLPQTYENFLLYTKLFERAMLAIPNNSCSRCGDFSTWELKMHELEGSACMTKSLACEISSNANYRLDSTNMWTCGDLANNNSFNKKYINGHVTIGKSYYRYYDFCSLEELRTDIHLIEPRCTPDFYYYENNPNITMNFIMEHLPCECFRLWNLERLATNSNLHWADIRTIYDLIHTGKPRLIDIFIKGYFANPNLTAAELEEILTFIAANKEFAEFEHEDVIKIMRNNYFDINTARRDINVEIETRKKQIMSQINVSAHFASIICKYIDFV